MKMCPWRAGPHDVCASRLVCGRQSCRLPIKGPQNHPVRSNGDRWTRLVERIGITTLCGPGQHIYDARNSRTWPRFVVLEVALFHCIATLSAHIAGVPTPVGSPGMQVKSLVPGRRIFIRPSESMSATEASFVMLEDCQRRKSVPRLPRCDIGGPAGAIMS
jgi:hypothetical protein